MPVLLLKSSMKRIGSPLVFWPMFNCGQPEKRALTLPRRWERYLPQKTEGFLTPSLVQRDMNRIITEIGTPANSPKPRGFSSGRTTGMIQTPRTRHEVIKKGKKRKKLELSTPIAV